MVSLLVWGIALVVVGPRRHGRASRDATRTGARRRLTESRPDPSNARVQSPYPGKRPTGASAARVGQTPTTCRFAGQTSLYSPSTASSSPSPGPPFNSGPPFGPSPGPVPSAGGEPACWYAAVATFWSCVASS